MTATVVKTTAQEPAACDLPEGVHAPSAVEYLASLRGLRYKDGKLPDKLIFGEAAGFSEPVAFVKASKGDGYYMVRRDQCSCPSHRFRGGMQAYASHPGRSGEEGEDRREESTETTGGEGEATRHLLQGVLQSRYAGEGSTVTHARQRRRERRRASAVNHCLKRRWRQKALEEDLSLLFSTTLRPTVRAPLIAPSSLPTTSGPVNAGH